MKSSCILIMNYVQWTFCAFILNIIFSSNTLSLRIVPASDQALEGPSGKFKKYFGAEDTAYNGTQIKIRIDCGSATEKKLNVRWLIRYSKCADEFKEIYINPSLVQYYFMTPMLLPSPRDYNHVIYYYSDKNNCTCETGHCIIDQDRVAPIEFNICKYVLGKNETHSAECKRYLDIWKNQFEKMQSSTATSAPSANRVKREPVPTAPSSKLTTSTKPTKRAPKSMKGGSGRIGRVWQDGTFLFVVEVEEEVNDKDLGVNITLVTDSGGYLPAISWPLLSFYGIMCVLYVIYGVVWLVLSAMHWKELLRVQFWIGGVIVMGMLEKAVFYAYYQHANSTGENNQRTLIFAELISCLKKMLARMLVVIVSLGFGIVKPRLGPMLHKVVGLGVLYFILAFVDSCLRSLSSIAERGNKEKLASIPVAVIDAAIFYWIFISLAQTMRTLRLRRNIVKLTLYRHFTNTLIFAALASIAFMVWVIKVQRIDTCMENWKEVWLVEAFWHILFVIVLLVIMVLWRPTANNQRYAFSVTIDAVDEEEEEPMMTDAYDGMKMRTKSSNGSPGVGRDEDGEDTLKWVEENIPSSVADSTLPALMDSDEEILTTRLEMSKMQ